MKHLAADNFDRLFADKVRGEAAVTRGSELSHAAFPPTYNYSVPMKQHGIKSKHHQLFVMSSIFGYFSYHTCKLFL